MKNTKIFKGNTFGWNLAVVILTFNSAISLNHYEKFFEVEGGPQYMYYFSKIKVGSPGSDQSAIIDTGSDTLAFPCNQCRSGDCGTHQDPRFFSSHSSSFSFYMNCPQKILYRNHQVCQFVKSYAEGSSLLGFLAEDYVRFKNARRVSDPKLVKLNSLMKKDMRVKAEFGCTTKETGLFKDQFADGIFGLDNGSTVIESIEKENSQDIKKVFSFGLCFHNSGGIMSVDLRKRYESDDKIVMLNKHINEYNEPLIVPYTDDDNYYEIVVSHFELNNIKIAVAPINMMIDSGTTFTHFPTSYLNKILYQLNNYCRSNIDKCGRLGNPNFKEDSCLELKQPDENYRNEHDLLASFPDIKIHLGNSPQPYILHPKNYFYKEFDDKPKPDSIRICLALKGEEEGRIILGAFSMIDNYFYFDRKERKLKVFKENCFLRTQALLKMKKERILSEIFTEIKEKLPSYYYFTAIGSLICILAWIIRRKKAPIDEKIQIAPPDVFPS
jgi:hypothetical protein